MRFKRREKIRFKDYDPLSPRDIWRFNRHPFRWALALVRPVKAIYLVSLLIVIVTAAMVMVPGIITGRLVDEVLTAGDHTNLWLYVGLIFGVPAARGLLLFLQRNLFEYTSQHALLRLRDALYLHLQKLDQRFYSETPTGTIMAKLTGDIDMVRYFLAWAGYATVEQLALFVAGGIYLLFLNWKLALASLAVVPILFLMARLLQKDIRPVWSNIRQQFERLNAVVQVNITGNRVTRAFVRHEFEVEKFETENVAYQSMNMEGAQVRSKYIPVMDGLSSFMSIPVILIGGIMTINGAMTIGELVAFNSLLFLLNGPTRMIGFLINDLQHVSSSAIKIIELLMTRTHVASPNESALTEDPEAAEELVTEALRNSPLTSGQSEEELQEEKEKLLRREKLTTSSTSHSEETSKPGYVADKPFPLSSYSASALKSTAKRTINELVENLLTEDRPAPAKVEGDIVFDQVCFDYYVKGQNVRALHDISFHAKPGDTIGIIGETGSGKSSLVELIPRLDDPSIGRILLDGRDLRTWPLAELRRAIGVVTQEVFLFSDTVEGNIAFVDPLMPAAEVSDAADTACADDFIGKMSEGYDTIVGERGVGLSGGQRQRISLARAIAGDPAILILDDTTSAVDMNTDTAIRENLQAKLAAKTVFIVAQRISSVRDADLILVMEAGRVKERGTHAELVALDGIYADIYHTQMGDQAEALAILNQAKEGGQANGK